MPTLIDFRRRIRSVRNTQKITRAMKLVSAAKLRRAQDRVFHARPYAGQMVEVLRSLARRTEVRRHPLLEIRPEEKVLVLVLSGDKGLCGPFNTNVIRLAERFLAAPRPVPPTREPQLIAIGKKGRDYFRRRRKELTAEYVNVFLRVVEYAQAREIAARVIELYEKKEVDAVFVIYNEFKSILAQRLITEKLLPLEGILPTRVEGALAVPGKEAYEKPAAAPVEAAEGVAEVDYIYEQPPAELFNRLLPRYVEVQIYRALLESAAAEQAARMTAMDNATSNAAEMIDRLTLNMNKARQAQITKELIEIVSGAAAL
ncbi:MAG TPA: ATP synthase F1 subunit gamma [Candidatus Xenobia bacterium]|nr:ATP synthase F1 subunit gamma [Candidatus Xenobia bacterium]